MKPIVQLLTAAILLLMATTSLYAQTTRYVDSTGTDSGGCSNPASPCATINYAIGQAGTGDIIDLAAGAYTETIEIDKSLTIQGAGNIQPGGTIIQGHQNPGEVEVVVFAQGTDTDLEISNLIIRNGFIGILSNVINSLELNEVTVRAIESSGASGAYGIYALSTPTTLTDVTIADNYSDSSEGVGMVTLGVGGTLTMENVLFHNNVTEATDSSAGGLYILGGTASPTLTNVTFSQNKAELNGGALYMVDVDNPVLTNVTFTQNEAKYRGGALYMEAVENAVLTNVAFTENEARGAGGAGGGAVYSIDSSATFTNTQFDGNITEPAEGHGGSGGALLIAGGENITFTDVILSNNEAQIGGAVLTGGTNTTFTNAQFIGNESLQGGGVSAIGGSTTIVNSLFAGNYGGGSGGAAQCFFANLTLINSTITSNEATTFGGGLSFAECTATISNTIVWGNTVGSGDGNDISNVNSSSTITATYSLYSDDPNDVDGDFACTNCTTDAPNFANPGAGNYQLSAGSPAIDAGDPATDLSVFPGGPTNPVDLNGAARVHGGTIDMGAYEFLGALPDQIFADRFQ